METAYDSKYKKKKVKKKKVKNKKDKDRSSLESVNLNSNEEGYDMVPEAKTKKKKDKSSEEESLYRDIKKKPLVRLRSSEEDDYGDARLNADPDVIHYQDVSPRENAVKSKKKHKKKKTKKKKSKKSKKSKRKKNTIKRKKTKRTKRKKKKKRTKRQRGGSLKNVKRNAERWFGKNISSVRDRLRPAAAELGAKPAAAESEYRAEWRKNRTAGLKSIADSEETLRKTAISKAAADKELEVANRFMENSPIHRPSTYSSESGGDAGQRDPQVIEGRKIYQNEYDKEELIRRILDSPHDKNTKLRILNTRGISPDEIKLYEKKKGIDPTESFNIGSE